MQALYAKATKAELNKDLDSAFKSYIEAAKAFLHLSRSSSDEKLQTKLKSDAGKALQRAEKIKAAKSDLTPVIRDPSSEGNESSELTTKYFVLILIFEFR